MDTPAAVHEASVRRAGGDRARSMPADVHDNEPPVVPLVNQQVRQLRNPKGTVDERNARDVDNPRVKQQ